MSRPFTKYIGLATAHEVNELIDHRECEGLPVYNFNQGLISVPPPKEVIDFADGMKVKDYPLWSMGPVKGTDDLRIAVADWMNEKYEQDINCENVLITVGGNAAFNLVVETATRPKDVVFLIEPYFFNHNWSIRKSGRVARSEELIRPGYTLDIQKVRDNYAEYGIETDSEVPRLFVLSNPINPTGTMLSEEELSQLEKEAQKRRAKLVIDRSYEGLDLRATPTSSAEKRDINTTVSIISFTKTLGLGDLRLGAVVADKKTIDEMVGLQDCRYICASVRAQRVAEVALEYREEHQRTVREELRLRREVLKAGLEECDWVEEVTGYAGPFLWVKHKPHPDKFRSLAVVNRLLEETGVAVTEGEAYGVDHHIRFAYGMLPVTAPKNEPDITKAVQALKSFTL